MTSVLDRPADLPEEFRLMINTLTSITANDDDSLSVSVDIAANILRQTTLDGIFAASEAATVSGEDFVGVPFPLAHKNITWRKSGDQFKDQGGFPFYALVQTVNADGIPIALTCGGVSVAPTIFNLWDGGHLEQFGDEGVMVELYEIRTGSGYDLLKLRRYAGKTK